jgi:DNA-binding transcriptional LysR family regulator
MPILESGSTDLLCRLAEQGMGVAYLPDYVTEKSVCEGRLCRLDVPDVQVEIWKQMFYHRDKWVSPQMKIVMDYLTKK